MFRLKWQWIRRATLIAVNALYLTPALLGWAILKGDLSASTFLGISLVDPLAALQTSLASRAVYPEMFLAALVILVFYMIAGGRTFCSWVCPFHLLAEAGEGLRSLLGRSREKGRYYSLRIKYGVLILVLLLSAVLGLPAFETVSPIGIASRNLIYGAGLGLIFLLVLLLVEMIYAPRLWCRSLCPLGAFYGAAGRWGIFRVRVNSKTCPSKCNRCREACFVPEILDSSVITSKQWIRSGECTNCGACVDRCVNGTLSFGVRTNSSQ